MRKRTITTGLVLVLIASTLAAAEAFPPAQQNLPPSHRDFYPSVEHPVSWRGDASGAWPGATPVREWDAATGRNVVWKTPMPGPSFSQPIIVGDKVFTLADPNWLICVSAVDGKILWQREVDQISVLSPVAAAKPREATAFWEDLFSQYASGPPLRSLRQSPANVLHAAQSAAR